jgi:hypothetical protein
MELVSLTVSSPAGPSCPGNALALLMMEAATLKAFSRVANQMPRALAALAELVSPVGSTLDLSAFGVLYGPLACPRGDPCSPTTCPATLSAHLL